MELIVDFPRRQKSPRGLQVSFAGELQTIFFKKASPEHRNDLWHTKCELLSFRCEARKLMLETAREAAHNMHGPTGYENYLKSPTEVSHRRQIHTRVILSKQSGQFLAGVSDPDALARISEANCGWCLATARTTALVHHVSCLSRDLYLSKRWYSIFM